jgi:uncharacterized protein (UPF0332 family)
MSVKWMEGRDAIEALLERGELQRVHPDLSGAERLISAARRHLESAQTIRTTDAEGAFAALYDAARKACAALLEAQGLRPTSRGGHIAVREAVVAQFGSLTGGDVVRRFDRLRRRRNAVEYPDSESAIDVDEVNEALLQSEAIVSFAEKLVDELPVF